MSKKFLILMCALVFTGAFALPVVYQGKLTDVDDIGLNGDYDIAFGVYDDPTAGTEVDADTLLAVAVDHGLFASVFDIEIHPLYITSDLYIQISINDGGGWDDVLPRQLITTEFRAMWTDNAVNAIYADTAYFAEAESVAYDNTTSGLTSDNVQDAIDEMATGGSLQDAYDIGNIIIGDDPVEITTNPGEGRALTIVNGKDGLSSSTAAAIYVRNDSTGPAIYANGNIVQATGGIWGTNGDVTIQLDLNDNTDDVFEVLDGAGATVFEVDEGGNGLFIGDLEVQGIVDPVGVAFVPQAVDPGLPTPGLWVDDAAPNVIWYWDGTTNIDLTAGGGPGAYIEDQDAAPQDAVFWVEHEGNFGTYMTGAEIDIWTDDFEDGVIDDWDTTNFFPTGEPWSIINPEPRIPAGGCSGEILIVDDDYAGSGVETHAEALSPIIDLSTFIGEEIHLELNHRYYHLSSVGSLMVYDGTVWVLLDEFTSTVEGPLSYDISAHANANFQIRLVYDDGDAWAWYWMVDNFRIYWIEFSVPTPTIIADGTNGNVELLTTAGDVIFNGTGLKTPGGAGVVGYDNTTSGLLATDVQGAIDEIGAIGTPDDYVQNQDASAQSADFWIDGTGQVEDDLTVGYMAPVFSVIGTAASNHYYYPACYIYDNTISQSIYLAAEIGATGNITDIGWHRNSDGTGDTEWQTCQIYLGTTALTDLTGGYIDPAGAGHTLIYDSNWIVTQGLGWKDINLATPFNYATDNLIVTIITGDDWSGRSSVYWDYTAATDMHCGDYEDGAPPTPLTNDYRPDFHIMFTSAPLVPAGGNLVALNEIVLGGVARGTWPGATGDFIENQNAIRQPADFWIEGEGRFGGGTPIVNTLLDEGFEGAFPPAGWTAYEDGDPAGWQLSTTNSHSGSNSAWHDDDNVTTGCIDYIVSPMIVCTGATDLTLTFWDDMYSATWYDSSYIVISTVSATGPWTGVWNSGGVDNDWGVQLVVDLSAYDNEPQLWIAWVYEGDYAHEWFIDDILLLGTVAPAPGEVVINNGDVDIEGELDVGGDAYIGGKLNVTGLIDPTGLQLDEQVSNPIPLGEHGIYVDQADDKLYYYDGTTVSEVGGGGAGGCTMLDGAYDCGGAGAGSDITADNGPVSIIALGAANGALVLLGDDPTNSTLFIDHLAPFGNGIWNEANYFSPLGNVALGAGFFHTDIGQFQSNADFIAMIDADDDADNAFIVQNSAGTGVFIVDEYGTAVTDNMHLNNDLIIPTGGINDGVGTGLNGMVLTADGAGHFNWLPPVGGADGDWTRTGNYLYPVNTTDSVGIGITSPAYILHVEGVTGDVQPVGYFENTTPSAGLILGGVGVWGQSNVDDYYGFGVVGVGGWKGVHGEVVPDPAGVADYHGVYGIVSGGNGYNFGVHGNAEGENCNYGVMGEATGSPADSNFGVYGLADNATFNRAGYFEGSVEITDSLIVNGDAHIVGILDPTAVCLTPLDGGAPPTLPQPGFWVDGATGNQLMYFDGTTDNPVNTTPEPRTIIKLRADGSGHTDDFMEALAMAEGAGPENPMVIDIGPGIYDGGAVPPEVILPPYVQLRGLCDVTVIIRNYTINMLSYTEINNITFYNVSIKINSVSYTYIYQCIFNLNCEITVLNSYHTHVYNCKFYTTNININVELSFYTYFYNNYVVNNYTLIDNSSYTFITNNYYYYDIDMSVDYFIHVVNNSNNTTIVNNYYYTETTVINFYAIYIDDSDGHVEKNTFINIFYPIYITNITIDNTSIEVHVNIFKNCNYGPVIVGPITILNFRFVFNSNIFIDVNMPIYIHDGIIGTGEINGNDLLGDGTGTGIYLTDVNSVDVMSNKIVNFNIGMYVTGSSGIIKDNISRGNVLQGFQLGDSYFLAENNVLLDNGNVGIWLSGDGSYTLNRNEIANNTTADMNYSTFTGTITASFNNVSTFIGGSSGAIGSYNVNAAGMPIVMP